MPRTRRASGKRRRTKLHELIWQMETPLAEAIDLVEALRLMGSGLNEHGCDDGSAVLRVVDATRERLQNVEEAWSGLVRAQGRLR